MNAERPRRAVTRRNEALTNKTEYALHTFVGRYRRVPPIARSQDPLYGRTALARRADRALNSTRGRTEVENLRRRARARNSTRVFSLRHRDLAWNCSVRKGDAAGVSTRCTRFASRRYHRNRSTSVNIVSRDEHVRGSTWCYVYYIIRSRLQLDATEKNNRRRFYT